MITELCVTYASVKRVRKLSNMIPSSLTEYVEELNNDLDRFSGFLADYELLAQKIEQLPKKLKHQTMVKGITLK